MKAPLQAKKSQVESAANGAGLAARSFGPALPELRERVSRVTGVDLSRIPVESGEAGGKRAVTHRGRVELGTKATGLDVAHELAHAAQQRAATGEWLNAGQAERRADEVAAAVFQGSADRIAAGRVPEAAVLGAGDPYSREAVTLPAPPAGVSPKGLRDLLDAKVKAGDITGYSISGVKAGEPEEPFLLNAILVLATTKRWGSEMDLITPIGGKADGEVTVRFDAAGKADAQLVGKAGPVVPAAFATVKDASAALVAKYKLTKVDSEHGKAWSPEDLNKVYAAWGRLSGAEAAALEGYALIRTDKLSLHGEDVGGLTSHSDELATGATQVKHTREIRFADSTFAEDARSFIGGAGDAAPSSFETLIHETGHAIESKAFDDLNAVAAKDSAGANQGLIDAHTAQVAANKAINAALTGSYPKKDTTTGQPLVDEVLNTQKVLKAFEASPDTANDTAAKAAIKARDAAKTAIPAANSVVKGFAAAIAAQDGYVAALGTLLAATNTATASRAAADATKASSGNTKRLQMFVDFVVKENIKRPTAYAEKHWPAEPAEFYDEAFSLWKNDKVFFAKYSPKLQAWFDAGNHLK